MQIINIAEIHNPKINFYDIMITWQCAFQAAQLSKIGTSV